MLAKNFVLKFQQKHLRR